MTDDSRENTERPKKTDERGLERFEPILEVARKTHNQAITGMADVYVVETPEGRKLNLVYHDFEKLRLNGKIEGMGHVKNVAAMQRKSL